MRVEPGSDDVEALAEAEGRYWQFDMMREVPRILLGHENGFVATHRLLLIVRVLFFSRFPV